MWTKWWYVYVVLVWAQNVLFFCGNMAHFCGNIWITSINLVCHGLFFVYYSRALHKEMLFTDFIYYSYLYSFCFVNYSYLSCTLQFFCYHREADNSFIKIRKLIPASMSPLFLGIPYMMSMSRCHYYPDDRVFQVQS